jgi:hypothetical protein
LDDESEEEDLALDAAAAGLMAGGAGSRLDFEWREEEEEVAARRAAAEAEARRYQQRKQLAAAGSAEVRAAAGPKGRPRLAP